VTHDSLRLVDQVKTIAEQRIYLDEAKELFTLLTNKSIQVCATPHAYVKVRGVVILQELFSLLTNKPIVIFSTCT
jgi:hypothetical protein